MGGEVAVSDSPICRQKLAAREGTRRTLFLAARSARPKSEWKRSLIGRWMLQHVKLETRLVGMGQSDYSHGGTAVSDEGDFRLPTYN